MSPSTTTHRTEKCHWHQGLHQRAAFDKKQLSTSKYTKKAKCSQQSSSNARTLTSSQRSKSPPLSHLLKCTHTPSLTKQQDFHNLRHPKNEERQLESHLTFGHSSSKGAEKPESQTPFFPDVVRFCPCTFVNCSSQQ